MSRDRMLSGPIQKRPASPCGGRPAFFISPHWASFLRSLFLGAPIILVLAGCESPDSGVIDPAGQPPFVAASRVEPDTVDLRRIPPTGDRYPVSITVRADVAATSTVVPPLAVTATLIPPRAGFPSLEAALRDDGSASDSVAGDGTYSGELNFDVLATEAGLYRLRVTARSADGYESVSRERIVPITRNNARPVLSDLSAPDTVDAPTTERLLIVMAIRAGDPDGAEDVQEVYFRSLDSSDPERKFFLLDDGNPGSSGDRAAGDGIYSIIVELLPGTPARTFRFAFQAADTFRDTSDTVLHFLTVR